MPGHDDLEKSEWPFAARPEEIQPKSFAFTPENEAFAEREIAKYPPGRQASAVIPLLWQAQEQHGGWLPQKAIEAVAAQLDMAYIRVMEVATFYTMFNLEPVGKYFIQFCGTTPCMLRGAGDIKKVLEQRVGDERHVSADGNFSWLEVECLGACCNAPMVQINDDYYEDLTPENFDKLLDDLAAGRPVKQGSQIGRDASEPLEAVKTLTDPALYDGSVVGAWRKRFEEEAKVAETGEAAAGPLASVPAAGQGREAGRRAAPSRATAPTRRPSAPRKASSRRPGRPQGAAGPVEAPTKVAAAGAKPRLRREASAELRKILTWRHRRSRRGRQGGASLPDHAGSPERACAEAEPRRDGSGEQAGRGGRRHDNKPS